MSGSPRLYHYHNQCVIRITCMDKRGGRVQSQVAIGFLKNTGTDHGPYSPLCNMLMTKKHCQGHLNEIFWTSVSDVQKRKKKCGNC